VAEPFQAGEEPFGPGVLHRPERESGDAILLTHGAGFNCASPLLVNLARAFAGSGHLVWRYNLPFRVARPQGPPFPAGAARDREGIAEAITTIRKLAGGRIIAGGHSYGGRQTAMLAAERPGLADALLLLSYPLHPPDKPARMRVAYFPDLRTPALFVHGTADPFGSLEELRQAIAAIPARTDVLPVEGAAHDLKRAPDLAADILSRLNALIGPGE
jgi:predicted alpha/beta-hydrolase family hydrolase